MPIRHATLMAIMLSFFVISPASAEQIGDVGYYRVAHVADDDMLMVRAKPSAAADQIGSFGPHAKPIEVFETDHGWARVSANGRTGWVSMAYLAPYAPRMNKTLNLPEGFQCWGTEPFWSAKFSESEVILSGVETISGDTLAIDSASGAPWKGSISLDNGTGKAIIHATRSCSDGMSDARYGWKVSLTFRQTPPDSRTSLSYRIVRGCCRVPPKDQ
ncbi:MAG: hypothetical protein CMI59_10055 [Parvibaculum sp.]|nr:hypothetical protein [Parvibaculum sp.]